MDSKLVKTVLMHGPGISDPSKTVERDVPERDVQAYKAAGYALGPMPKAAQPEAEVEVFKSAETGEFVSKDEAKASPATTYKTKAAKKAK